MELRDYQQKAVAAGLEAIAGGRSALLVLATGCGKTVCFASLIDRVLRDNPGKVAVVLAHREELIRQAVDKIERFTGRRCAIEMAGLAADLYGTLTPPEVIVSTIQTQNAGRPPRMERVHPEDVALVIVDEAHHAVAASYRKVVGYYRAGGAALLGVTATPDRADEVALAKVFDVAPYVYDVADAIRDGWLVPIKQQICKVTGLDYSSVRTTAGDLNGGDLAEVMEAEGNLQGVASATLQVAGERKTLIFAASVKHAERLAEILNRHRPGRAASINGGTDKVTRAKIVRDYAEGRLQFVCNVGVFTEGFDDPGVECVVMARATQSRALYAQMLGRGTRPAECVAHTLGRLPGAEERRAAIAKSGKGEVLVLDFEGNAGRHKLVTSLDVLGGKDEGEEAQAIRRKAKDIVEEEGEQGRALDPEAALEMAKAKLEEEREEEARRLKLRAKATYSVIDVSPFYGALGIDAPMPLPQRFPRKLSEKQVAALEKFGVKGADKVSYADGKRLLEECFRRTREGLPSLKQIRLLEKIGAPVPETRAEATDIIGRFMAGQRRVAR